MRTKEWTEAEDAILRERREAGIKVPVIAAELGRPVAGTYARARQIGTRVMSRREWDEVEVARLTELYAGEVAVREIARILDRPENSVRWKLDDLGLGGKRVRYWTPEEDREMARLVDGKAVGDVDLAELALAIAEATGTAPRVPGTLDSRIRTLGLYASRRRRWSVADIRALKQAVAADDIGGFAERTGRPVTRVVAKAVELGLRDGAAGGTREYTEREDLAVRDGVARGLGFDRIGTAIGRTERSARNRARKLGLLETRSRVAVGATERALIVEAAASGESVVQTARRLGRDTRTVKAVAEGDGVAFAARTRVAAARPAKAVVRVAARPVAPAARVEPKPRTVVVRTSEGFRRVTPLAPMDMSSAIERFLAERGATRADADPVEAVLRRLRARGYSVVTDGEGWVVDGRNRIPSPEGLAAFAEARGLAA